MTEDELNISTTKNGYSPLYLALKNGAGIETINTLLKAGAHVNAIGEDENTPLHIALKNGASNETINTLLNAGAHINAIGENENTPLHIALFNNADIEIIKTLLEAGADISAKNKFRYTPLSLAFEKTDGETSRVLLKKGINSTRLTQDFLDKSLHGALSNQKHDVELIQELISLGANVNATLPLSNSMLETALSKSLLSLIQDNSSPDYINNPNVEVIKALINAGAKVGKINNPEGTVLHKCVDCDDLQILKTIIAANPNNVNTQNNRGNTPLHVIADILNEKSSLKIGNVRANVILLIKNGADFSIKNKEGKTPLEMSPELKKIITDYETEKKLENDLTDMFFGNKVPEPKDYKRTLADNSKEKKKKKLTERLKSRRKKAKEKVEEEVPLSTFIEGMETVLQHYFEKPIPERPKRDSENKGKKLSSKKNDKKGKGM